MEGIRKLLSNAVFWLVHTLISIMICHMLKLMQGPFVDSPRLTMVADSGPYTLSLGHRCGRVSG